MIEVFFTLSGWEEYIGHIRVSKVFPRYIYTIEKPAYNTLLGILCYLIISYVNIKYLRCMYIYVIIIYLMCSIMGGSNLALLYTLKSFHRFILLLLYTL